MVKICSTKAVNNARMALRRKRILRFVSFADLQPQQDGVERAAEVLVIWTKSEQVSARSMSSWREE